MDKRRKYGVLRVWIGGLDAGRIWVEGLGFSYFSGFDINQDGVIVGKY